jgi:hypothetical protein
VNELHQSEERNPSAFSNLSDVLKNLDRNGGTAAVVVALKAPTSRPVPPPEETERLAKKLISDAEKATGGHSGNANVFRRFGRFVLEAPAEIIRHIAAQPEVEDITPNQQSGFGLITPVKRGPIGE